MRLFIIDANLFRLTYDANLFRLTYEVGASHRRLQGS